VARVLLAAIVLGAATLGVAYAAATPLTSQKLTASSTSSSVAISTCTLPDGGGANGADRDTHVDEFQVFSNFGTATGMDVQSSTFDKRSLVSFSLASCSIPATASVRTATLTLFMSAAPAASRTYEVRRVTATWTETGVNWSNQPAVAGSATATFATGTTTGARTASVLADVQAFVAGTQTNYGWRIGDQTEGASGSSTFSTAEHGTSSQRPKLEITYYP
jgi:hypothetical protein